MKHTLYLGVFDRREDERALREGTRIVSAYETPTGRVWIITERATSEVTLPGMHRRPDVRQ
jgi:hypothetical protein